MEEIPTQILNKSPGMSDIGKSSLFTQSQYAKVIFHDIWDWYPTDADIVCRYTVTKGVVTNAEDKVALFPVGWTSASQDAILSLPVPKQASSSLVSGPGIPEGCHQEKVVFKVQDIPKDLQEFYQICYVGHSDSGSVTVCGASAPFQFRSPQDSGEWCEVEDAEDGILIVRSRAAVDQENLQKALKKGEQLQLEKKQVEIELQKITKELSECKIEAGKLRTEIEDLKAERKQLQDRVLLGEHVERHVLRLQGEARALDADRNETGDKLSHAQRHIKVLEATIDTLGADKEHILELLRAETRRGTEIAKRLEEVLMERENLKKQFDNIQEEKEKLNENLMLTLKELSNLKSFNQDKDKQSTTEIESVRQILSLTEKKLEASQKQTLELETLYKKQSKLLESEEDEVGRLKEQVSDMQIRLEMAAEEYRKIYAAHVRAERRLSRRQHSGGRSGSADDSGGGSRPREWRRGTAAVGGAIAPTDGETGEQKVGESGLIARSNIPSSDSETNSPSRKNRGTEEGCGAIGLAAGRALESLHDMNICFVCPICSVTFPPGDSALFSSHFQNHLS